MADDINDPRVRIIAEFIAAEVGWYDSVMDIQAVDLLKWIEDRGYVVLRSNETELILGLKKEPLALAGGSS